MSFQYLSDIPYIWTVSIAVILALLPWPVYNLFLHPLSAIPGPRLWALTWYFYARAIRGGKYAQKSLRLHSKYGPVIRIAPNQLSVTTDEAWKVVFAYNSGTSFPKSLYWYQARANGFPGILASPNSRHGRFRKVFAKAFTEKSVADHQYIIDNHVQELIDKLTMLSGQGASVNFTDESDYLSFDIAGDFAYSRSFECLQKPDNREQIRTLQRALKLFTMNAVRRMMGVEKFANLIDNAFASVQLKKTLYARSIKSWAKTRLQDTDEDKKPDLMGCFADSTRASTLLRPEEAENSIGDFMMAGSETVSTTLVPILDNLTNHPEVQVQLRAELQALAQVNGPIEHDRLAQAPLLNAVINETMRLAPSVPFALSRTVPSPGTRLAAYFLPAGTEVAFNQYAAYRDPAYFSEPTKFNPQRWVDPASVSAHNADVFRPFSVGPRDCIGKHWGLRAVRVALSQLLLHFEIERTETDWAWDDQDANFGWEKKALMLKFKPVS